jgi:outer membrane lipoprotein-sorting protein
MKNAASIAILAAMGFFTDSTLNPTKAPAFEDVARAILMIENASFEITSVSHEPDEDPETARKVKCIAQLPGRLRIEDADGVVIIADFAADNLLFLNPKHKGAMLIEGFSDSEVIEKPADFIGQMQDHLRRAADNADFADVKYTKLGEKRFNDRPAIGYRIHDPEVELYKNVDIWADAETSMPVRLEYSMEIAGAKTVHTLKAFKYNQKLDPKLFSLEPPAGYKLTNKSFGEILEPVEVPPRIVFGQVEIEGVGMFGVSGGVSDPFDDQATLEDLANTLRVYAERTDGHFPPALASGEMIDAMSEGWEKANPGKPLFEDDAVAYVDEELSAAVDGMLHSFKLVSALEKQGIKYTYAGRGVKVGDRDRPVFWYEPKDSDAFRVIYGDLSIRELDKAPAKP